MFENIFLHKTEKNFCKVVLFIRNAGKCYLYNFSNNGFIFIAQFLSYCPFGRR